MIVVPQIAFHATEVAMGEELPPVRLVRELVKLGAERVSILDLDGTLANDVLPQWVEALVAVAGVPLQFDGRLHEGSRIERIARAGFAHAVVDQTGVFDPLVLRWAMDLYGDRLLVEVQVDGEYVFDAPPTAFADELVEVLAQLHFQGARRFLYRDVTGVEVSLQRLLSLRDRLPGATLTYQGTVRDVIDIAEIASIGSFIEAVIVPADDVLDGLLDLDAARRAARSTRS